ncbi:MAG: T9SS type A sorting domain-containing protein [Bacteroidota bacterium]
MKSILLSTIFVTAGIALSAQTLPVKLSSRQPNYAARNGGQNETTSIVDTVDVYILRATSGSFYQGQDGGYIFGTSYFFDTTSGMFFPVTDESGIGFDGIGNADVTDILFWAGAKQITGNPDSITGKIYAAGPDSMPTTLLGSGTMSMQDVDTSLSAPTFTDLVLSSPVAITSSFFASIAYAGNDDTLGFLSSGLGNGLMEKRIRQKASADFGGVWVRMGELYPSLDLDLFFAPIVTLAGVGIDNHFAVANAALGAVYPTIANSEVHIDYTLNANSTVSYFLFDMKGKKYFEQQSEQQHAGSYSQAFDVSNLGNGNYFLSVTINGKTVTQKVIVTK